MAFSRTRVCLCALACSVAAAAAAGQTSSFILLKSGKQVGHASYTIDKIKEGERVRSRFEYRFLFKPPAAADADTDSGGGGGRRGGGGAGGGGGMIEAQVTFEYKVNAEGSYLGGYLNDSGTQMMTSYTPSKMRDAVTQGKVQAGLAGMTDQIPMPKPNFMVTPAFDPSAVQVLLTAVRDHPHPDHLYVVLDPGFSGRGLPAPAYLAVGDAIDGTGELDGKPAALKIYPVRWQKASGWIYSDADGKLMQADVGTIDVSYVRTGFKLTSPPPVYKPKAAATADAAAPAKP